MTTLALRFLGPMELRWGDQLLSKPATRKAQSLLAYLVIHRNQPQLRDKLGDLYWGEWPERKARRSLTTALWRIHRCFPNDAFLQTDPHTVQFVPPADFWLDVDDLVVKSQTPKPKAQPPKPTHGGLRQPQISSSEKGGVENVAMNRPDDLTGSYCISCTRRKRTCQSICC